MKWKMLNTDHWVVCTSILDDISDKMLLTVVSGQDRDLLSWIPTKSHVHECCDDVFSLGQVLIEVWRRFGFSYSVEIANINELKDSGNGNLSADA